MGWPGIRLRVFHELIYAARQLGNDLVVIRYVTQHKLPVNYLLWCHLFSYKLCGNNIAKLWGVC